MKKWVLLSLILAIGMILVIGGCAKKEEKAPVVPVKEPEPVAPVEETPVEPAAPTPTETPAVNEETGKIDYGSRGILSDVKCEGKVISAIITNVFDTVQTATPNSYKSDLHIQVNGVNMQDFTCDKTEIGPKEYTYCSSLMPENLRDKMVRTDRANEVAVWFSSDTSNRGLSTVSCSS